MYTTRCRPTLLHLNDTSMIIPNNPGNNASTAHQYAVWDPCAVRVVSWSVTMSPWVN